MKFDWIPQLFMDFIGRILPGATILLAVRFLWVGDWNALPPVFAMGKMEINWGTVPLMLLVCYLTGVSLSQLWYVLLERFAKRKLDSIENHCKEHCLKEHNQLQEALGYKGIALGHENMPSGFVMHDHLRITLPQEANRLLKLRAESRFNRSLIIGLGVLCVINFAWGVCKPSMFRAIMEVLMACVVFTAWKREFRLQKYYMNGVCVMWLALVSTDRLLKPPTAGGAAGSSAGKDEE